MNRLIAIEKQILKNQLVNRTLAIEIDELTDGAVSALCHLNSFTEADTDVNMKEIMYVLHRAFVQETITMTLKETMNVINRLTDERKRLLEASKIKLNVNLYIDVIKCDKWKVGDVCVKDLKIGDVIEHHVELNEMFGKNLSIVKLRADYELVKGLNYNPSVETILDIDDTTSIITNLSEIISYLEGLMTKDTIVEIDPRSTTYSDLKEYNTEVRVSALEYIRGLLEV